ncbi:hypothetical protein IFM89_017431 [Coptis chinensis]|uniref:Uncharacterized protein n=1 Tax=Coptis chinensis TaxID=261450 RepID=A0A835H6Y2_9MAGN|nr:hypothetical protein IFM89_017431 [Coptis chinensis]
MVEMEKQKKGSSIALLQQRLNDIKKDIKRTKLNFACVAAAPWRSWTVKDLSYAHQMVHEIQLHPSNITTLLEQKR